ncbi:choice-of-anchor I family protein [Pseudomonas sp. FME51]|uniref:choice-of-anchor I family protein n=1 Tax=Pseudomonas sp. FME51 TaxID=2742609 RepID=UPI0018667581|nr:choice-of-anchor I family protein [Pseudomonas sp. FME51]
MNRWTLTALAAAIAVSLTGCLDSDSDNDRNQGGGDSTPISIELSKLGSYSTGEYVQSAAEIPAFDPDNQRIFMVNALSGAVDVLNAADPANPEYMTSLVAAAPDATVNSVAWHNGLLAVAVEAAVKTDLGSVELYDATTLELLDSAPVGALPDMVTFTPDGKYVLVANEGEPNDDYSIDPEGSISVIEIQADADRFGAVRTAGFQSFNDKRQELLDAGVRIYGPADNAQTYGPDNIASVARDVEPEYITVSADSSTAWVSLQENNAFAKLDIANATVTDILPLGFKDYGQEGNGIDASDDEGNLIRIEPRPGVVGMYHPDAISSYNVDGKTYIVSANEGDARAWGEDDDAYWAGDASKGFVEEFRVKHLVHTGGFGRRANDDLPPQLAALADGALLNPETFSYCGATAADPGDCREDEELGRLNISWVNGYRQNADGSPMLFDASGTANPAGNLLMYDQLYSYGARSFSIWDEDGEQVWDSGDFFEQFLANQTEHDCQLRAARDIPCDLYFNTGHDEVGTLDSRSDAKGPEPEGITLGRIGEQTFAFIGLERMGGVMVFDITDPSAPQFQDYLNTREDWEVDLEESPELLEQVGDLGPEGLVFVSAEQSPNGEPLLIVGNEVSGTTAIFQVNRK